MNYEFSFREKIHGAGCITSAILKQQTKKNAGNIIFKWLTYWVIVYK